MKIKETLKGDKNNRGTPKRKTQGGTTEYTPGEKDVGRDP